MTITHSLETTAGSLNVKVPGDILSTNAETLRQEIFGVLESPPVKTAPWTALNLDLTTAKMIDSAGLNLIVTIVKSAKSRGAKVGATITSPNVQRTFAFTRLDQQIDLVKI